MTLVEPPVAVLLVVAGLLLAVAATTAAGEAALTRLTRSEAAAFVAEGRRRADVVQRLVADPSPALSTATLLRVTAEAAATVCVALAVEELTDRWWVGLLVTAVVVAGFDFVGLGVAPRTLGRQHAGAVALRLAGFLHVLLVVLGPVARMLVALGNAVTPGKGFRDGPFASESELREMVDRATESDVIEAGERRMIHSVFELGDTLVREVMSPRTDMVTLAADTRARDALRVFLSSGHSRLPVVGASVDDVVGVLFLKDVVRAQQDRGGDARVVADLAREPVFVPESKRVDALLREMQQQSLHLALVVDEYGGVAGLVTLEDALEEIVGEISDEYDREEPEVTVLGDGSFRVSPRLPVDELGRLFGLETHDDEVDSVGGLVTKALGTLPETGATVRVGQLHLEAEAVVGHRITSVLARLTADVEAEQQAEQAAEHEAQQAAEQQAELAAEQAAGHDTGEPAAASGAADHATVRAAGPAGRGEPAEQRS